MPVAAVDLEAGVARDLRVEFVNNGRTFQAVWFNDSSNQSPASSNPGSYYTLDGKSLRRAYLASPLEFSRITSGKVLLQRDRISIQDAARSAGTVPLRDAAALLEPAGVLALEVDVRRASLVAELASADGRYRDVAVHLDLVGRERFVTATRAE